MMIKKVQFLALSTLLICVLVTVILTYTLFAFNGRVDFVELILKTELLQILWGVFVFIIIGSAISICCLLPSFIGIIVSEIQKLKKTSDYILSTISCVLIIMISVFAYMDIIQPFLKSIELITSETSQTGGNLFKNISTEKPERKIPDTEALLWMLGLSGFFICLPHTWLYCFLAVRKGK